MKDRSCCSTCLFTGGSISGRRPLIFKHGAHLSYGGKSGTFAANARTLAMCNSLAAAHSAHSQRVLFGFICLFEIWAALGGDHAPLVRPDCCP